MKCVLSTIVGLLLLVLCSCTAQPPQTRQPAQGSSDPSSGLGKPVAGSGVALDLTLPADVQDNALKNYNRGNDLYVAGDMDGAIKAFSDAVALWPLFAEAYDNRGLAYRRKGAFDKAIADHSKAIELRPRMSDAYCNRGTAYRAAGRRDLALKDYDTALSLCDQPRMKAVILNSRGATFLESGRNKEALADLTQAIELREDYAEAYYNRAQIYIAAQTREGCVKAQADLSRVIEITPNFVPALHNRAIMRLMLGDDDGAKQDIERCKALGHIVPEETIKGIMDRRAR
jgi:tetratricopeptide (TPR) repeat protein